MTDEWKKGFITGIIYSTALLLNTYNEGAAEDLWAESGYSKKDLKHAEKYDADIVLNCFYKSNPEEL